MVIMKKRTRTRALSLGAGLAGALLWAGAAQACAVAQTRGIFDYEGHTQTILDVEAAMARAQASHGVIPAKAAEEITSKAKVALVPQDAFDAQYAVVNHRMVALLNVWREQLNDAGDQYVHFGATTVDIYGTATVLQLIRAVEQLDQCLIRASSAMAALAKEHQATPMIGRTLGQHAQPITFGKKVSAWIGEYTRHRERLAQLRQRLMRSAILKGAVGNYSGLGVKAIAVEQAFASELGLAPPYASDWNGTRDVFAEFGLLAGLVAKSHERIGQELFLLQGTDIGEVREAQRKGVVGSSSMPHKRNPRAPEALIQAGRTIPRLGAILADDVVNFFERDNTSRPTSVIEDVAVQSVASARTLAILFEGLEIDATAMRTNINKTRGFAMSQRVAFALAQVLPRVEAEALVKQVIAEAIAEDISFAEALAANPATAAHLDTDYIAELLDPALIAQPALDQVAKSIEEAELQ